jgi:hypothetical protein
MKSRKATSEHAVTEEMWPMIESASRLLEADGWVIQPGVYGPWAVFPTRQPPMGLGYTAFLLASQ